MKSIPYTINISRGNFLLILMCWGLAVKFLSLKYLDLHMGKCTASRGAWGACFSMNLFFLDLFWCILRYVPTFTVSVINSRVHFSAIVCTFGEFVKEVPPPPLNEVP